jgi:hypothetical protein
VEMIVRRDNTGGVVSYLVRWKGYGSDKDEWLPVTSLNCERAINDYEEWASAEAELSQDEDFTDGAAMDNGAGQSGGAPEATPAKVHRVEKESSSVKKNRKAAANTTSIAALWGGAAVVTLPSSLPDASNGSAHRPLPGKRSKATPDGSDTGPDSVDGASRTRKTRGSPPARAAFSRTTPTSSPAKKKGRTDGPQADGVFLPQKLTFTSSDSMRVTDPSQHLPAQLPMEAQPAQDAPRTAHSADAPRRPSTDDGGPRDEAGPPGGPVALP